MGPSLPPHTRLRSSLVSRQGRAAMCMETSLGEGLCQGSLSALVKGRTWLAGEEPLQAAPPRPVFQNRWLERPGCLPLAASFLLLPFSIPDTSVGNQKLWFWGTFRKLHLWWRRGSWSPCWQLRGGGGAPRGRS